MQNVRSDVRFDDTYRRVMFKKLDAYMYIVFHLFVFPMTMLTLWNEERIERGCACMNPVFPQAAGTTRATGKTSFMEKHEEVCGFHSTIVFRERTLPTKENNNEK